MTRTQLFLTHMGVWLVICAIALSAAKHLVNRFDARSGWVGLAIGWASNFVAAIFVLGALGGCTQAPAPVPVTAPAPPAVELSAIEPVPPPEPVIPPVDPCGVSPEAITLIVRHEIGTPDLYTRKYQGLVCPGGASGPTWAIGYDGGHRPGPVILVDWAQHTDRDLLATASGVKGPAACRAFTGKAKHVRTPYPYARDVFDRTSLVEYLRLTRRAFGPDRFCAAPPHVRGALTDLVYNRGASMSGPNRSEMRAIRDECLPARDWGCVAHQLRTMGRVWKGTDIERTMVRRRNDEANLTELQT